MRWQLCLFFTNQFVVFLPLLRRVFTRELPVPGTSVSSVQPYPYPERLRVMYDIHTRTELYILVLFVRYTQNHTRGIYPGYYPTENFCDFCRTLKPLPGISVSSVQPYPYPECL